MATARRIKMPPWVNGQYSFTDLGPGTYQVSVDLRTGWSKTSATPAPIVMLSGAYNEVNVGLFNWNAVFLDLDVNSNGILGDQLSGGVQDGAASYTPGYQGNRPSLDTGTPPANKEDFDRATVTFNSQSMRLYLNLGGILASTRSHSLFRR